MPGTVYATVQDILAMGRSLTAAEMETADALLPQASAMLRVEARQYGKDIDAMIADPITGEDFAIIVKSVVCQSVIRALDVSEASESSNVSSAQETMGSYTYSYHYLNAGSSLYFLRNEITELGLNNQVYGALELY